MNRDEAAVTMAQAIIMGSWEQNQEIVRESNRLGIKTADGLAKVAYELADALIAESYGEPPTAEELEATRRGWAQQAMLRDRG